MSISVHREGVNPSSMEGVLDLRDHISVERVTKENCEDTALLRPQLCI